MSFFRRIYIRAVSALVTACLIVTCTAGCASITIERPADPEREIEKIPENDRHEKKPKGNAPKSDYDQVGNAVFPDSYESGPEGDYDVESGEVTYRDTGLDAYTEEELTASAAVNVGRFAYERLSPSGKRVYNEMYLTLKNMSDEYELDCTDVDEINRIFLCVMMDHPEIFWVSGYVYTRYTRGDVLEAMGFKGTYTMDRETADSRKTSIKAYVDRCLSGMPDGDDYSRIKYIYEYIIKNTAYDPESADNQNICSVFINGRSVCQGYAKATQYLLNIAGVKTTLITGIAQGQGNHAWNLVYADGSYYYLDTTWGDSNYRSEEGMEDTLPGISYDYLCVPGYEIFKTHMPEAPVELPVCSSISDNYYVREGAYFIGLDEDALRSLFIRNYEMGRDFVSLKASDSSTYMQIREYLLDRQMIFDMIREYNGSGTVSYWENQDLLIISFKLR